MATTTAPPSTARSSTVKLFVGEAPDIKPGDDDAEAPGFVAITPSVCSTTAREVKVLRLPFGSVTVCLSVEVKEVVIDELAI